MPLNADTKEIQTQLADYCRTGEYHPIPGVNPDRVQNYRRLVFNGVEDALCKAYPIAVSILGEERWLAFVKDFFSTRPSASPMLWRMPYELYQYSMDSGSAEKFDLPYLNDLLLFEWIEIEVHMMKDAQMLPCSGSGDVMKDPPLFNPYSRSIKLEYPVFRAGTDQLRREKGDFRVVCYRHPTTHKVHFAELSPQYDYLINTMKDRNCSGLAATNAMTKQFGLHAEDPLVREVPSFLCTLLGEKVILGFLCLQDTSSTIGAGSPN